MGLLLLLVLATATGTVLPTPTLRAVDPEITTEVVAAVELSLPANNPVRWLLVDGVEFPFNQSTAANAMMILAFERRATVAVGRTPTLCNAYGQAAVDASDMLRRTDLPTTANVRNAFVSACVATMGQTTRLEPVERAALLLARRMSIIVPGKDIPLV